MKRLVMTIVLFAASNAAARAADCANAADQTTMNQCAERDYKRSDDRLNTAYKQVMACLTPSLDAARPLVEAQRAWLIFREAECRFQGSASAGGTIQPMVILDCLKAVTDERIKGLDYYLTCQEGDASCPTAQCAARHP